MGSSPRLRPLRLAWKLRWVRAHLGLTQKQIAEALSDNRGKVNDRDISKFEAGRRDPTLIILLRYARLADLRMEVFADDDLSIEPNMRELE